MEYSEERRKMLDHDRYISHRESRLKKQREYYQLHRDYYLSYRSKRAERERNNINNA